jgi:hypothetical protein
MKIFLRFYSFEFFSQDNMEEFFSASVSALRSARSSDAKAAFYESSCSSATPIRQIDAAQHRQ